MLLFPSLPTILTLDVPVEWIVTEQKERLADSLFADFLRKFTAQPHGMFAGAIWRLDVLAQHPYAESVRYACRCGFPCDTPETLEERVKNSLSIDISNHLDFLRNMSTAGAPKPIPARLTALGTFELLDGTHRATHWVVAGARTLPLAIKHVSPAWEDMVNAIEHTNDGRQGWLYQPIEHPWFDSSRFDTFRVSETARAERIVAALAPLRASGSIPSMTHYDIGCATGHLCRAFARAGWASFGIETSAPRLAVAERLDAVFETQVAYYQHKNFTDILADDHYQSIGVVTCLSVLHHGLKEPKFVQPIGGRDERYIAALQCIADHSWAFVIDHSLTAEGFLQSEFTSIPLDVNDFRAFLVQTLGLRSCALLDFQDMELGRPVFLCSKRIEVTQGEGDAK